MTATILRPPPGRWRDDHTPLPQHGTRSRYRKGCHDECCRAAERNYRRAYRARQRASA